MTNEPQVIPLTKRQPDPAGDDLSPPDWLTEKGREAWDLLFPLHTVTTRDLPEFIAFCEAVGEFHESTEMISDVGLVVIDPVSGMPTPNPLTSIRDRADAKIARWAGRFH